MTQISGSTIDQVEAMLPPLIQIAALLELASDAVDKLPSEQPCGPAHTAHSSGSKAVTLIEVARDIVEVTAAMVSRLTNELLNERMEAR